MWDDSSLVIRNTNSTVCYTVKLIIFLQFQCNIFYRMFKNKNFVFG